MKHNILTRQCALSLILLFAPCVALQAATIYTASLSGATVNPAVISTGSGLASVEYDASAHTLLVDVSFAGLTAGVIAAHIHCCIVSPGNIGVASPVPSFPGFPLNVSSGSYSQLLDLTLATSFNSAFVTSIGGTVAGAEAALVTGLGNGQAYFNIHTTNFAGGEIRGFFAPAPVPVPAAVWLFGSGLLWLAGIARRTKAAGY